ncbi:MAG: cyclic nucleotide-binding domain-containing protein [Thermoplasmata archaeon]|jgi:CRP-like cAMP-binding protein
MMKPMTDPTDYTISEHPFLSGLSGRFLTQLNRGATPREYSVDEYLVREGEEANHLFLIYSGKVALEVVAPDQPPLTIETIGPGGVVGWSWSTEPRRYEHSARALRMTHAIAIEATVLRAACERDPADGYRFISRLLVVVVDRLTNTRQQLMDNQRR